MGLYRHAEGGNRAARRALNRRRARPRSGRQTAPLQAVESDEDGAAPRRSEARPACPPRIAAAPARFSTPSLSRIRFVCLRAVSWLMPSMIAISGPVSPWAIYCSTSASRSLSPQARHHPSAPRFVRTPSDLGALIRERRQKLGLDQLTLAKKAGTSRKWLIEVENGKPRAEIGLILRTLKALRIELTAKPPQNVSGRTLRKRGVKPIDIDSVINFLKSTHERPPPRNRQRQEMRAVALS